jgi:hypothetical protein
MLTPTLADYRRHAELYGPELIIETAAHDLDERDLAELRSYVRHLERTKRWKDGHWRERRHISRPCEECGLDLPQGASTRMRRHPSCASRASSRAHRQRMPV